MVRILNANFSTYAELQFTIFYVRYNVSAEQGTQNYKTRMMLTIRKFESVDIGDYNCISNNSQGGAEQAIRVSASPTINHPNSIEKRKKKDCFVEAMHLSPHKKKNCRYAEL